MGFRSWTMFECAKPPPFGSECGICLDLLTSKARSISPQAYMAGSSPIYTYYLPSNTDLRASERFTAIRH